MTQALPLLHHLLKRAAQDTSTYNTTPAEAQPAPARKPWQRREVVPVQPGAQPSPAVKALDPGQPIPNTPTGGRPGLPEVDAGRSGWTSKPNLPPTRAVK